MLVAIVATVAFTSCKPKLSDETKKTINDFKTDWNKMTGDLNAWGGTLDGDMTKLGDDHTKMGKEWGDTAKMSKDQKAKIKETLTNCAAAGKKLEDMKKTYTDFKKGIDTTTTAFTDWANKVDKGEVDDAAAKTAMEGYSKQLADAKSNMANWDKALTDLMMGEAKNHDDCMAVTNPKKDDKKAPAKK